MTALKSQFQKARVVLQSLVHGLNPVSGDELPKGDIVNNIEVNRAMSTAVMALDQMMARLTRREMLPERRWGKGVDTPGGRSAGDRQLVLQQPIQKGEGE